MTVAEKAQALLRRRLCSPTFAHAAFKSSPESNYSKLRFLISSSIAEACNNSVLLLGPRGSGKIAVVELVLEDLKAEHPDAISVIRLNGLLHSDDNCALKEIARQLCVEHQLLFSKMASSDDNSQFVMDMLRECGLAHKTIIVILDEFDLFTQDADQLLEKRIRSRFSHRKLLFVPPSKEDVQRLLECLLHLPKDSSFPSKYVTEFNRRLSNILSDKKFKEVLDSLLDVDGSVSNLLRLLFRAVSYMDMESGLLSLENFKSAYLCTYRQPKIDNLEDASILELYILVCMNRLETKEQNSYNFNSIMKEYKAIHDAYKTSDNYANNVCLRAFEHLLEQELIGFTDSKGRTPSIEFHPVKLLISSRELYQGLTSNSSCPAILQKLFDHESYK
uniref:Origin of replication complex subunit 4 n=2 Tax=Elaeis guineensis var. tenera TaxID=51953 RepID=A0A6I9RJU8_ELAGV|nr:origin of replication complex subunit 4 isoform X2 [Elaeis guineensis]